MMGRFSPIKRILSILKVNVPILDCRVGMAKLTLTFNGKPIRAYQFEAGDSISIGRSDENEIQIDSLAVGPVHAEIKIGDGESIINSHQTDFPVQVNNLKITQHTLQHGDQISIGKHILYFTEDTTVLETSVGHSTGSRGDVEYQLLNEELKQSAPSIDGQLQILNGRNIGRLVALKGGLTRLGKPETGVAVIAKRKDGFYIASLDGAGQIRLNSEPIQDKSVKLTPGDLLEIDRTEMQFFCQ
jgi:FHA domain